MVNIFGTKLRQLERQIQRSSNQIIQFGFYKLFFLLLILNELTLRNENLLIKMEHVNLFEKLKLSYQEFANSSTWKVNSTEFQNDILGILCRWWNDFECKIFPGPQPVSIERKHFDILKTNEYWVCEKTDGVRFIFLAVKIGYKCYNITGLWTLNHLLRCHTPHCNHH